MNEQSCIVVTIRSDKEHLILHTTDGPVYIHLQPRNKTRTQVVIEAPRKVGVRREPNKEQAHAE
jgi:hypothetical protein